jgi:anti-sigma factor RsiW
MEYFAHAFRSRRERRMRCRELAELVTNYLEGALPAAEVARVEAHLARCADCGAHLHQTLETIRMLRRLRGPHRDPRARAELRELFRRETGAPPC